MAVQGLRATVRPCKLAASVSGSVPAALPSQAAGKGGTCPSWLRPWLWPDLFWALVAITVSIVTLICTRLIVPNWAWLVTNVLPVEAVAILLAVISMAWSFAKGFADYIDGLQSEMRKAAAQDRALKNMHDQDKEAERATIDASARAQMQATSMARPEAQAQGAKGVSST
ncbi:hypothetical protein GPECTOR_19g372 [Gonium pectorale]|uniref:Uncharacterized protein n=1 Tax=Gonium pectorale TaxID=33097 RepID=A0A150GJF0_GONPE|nr:hypothetical protein GPECTOR_19g372 [Gonium pectorale]|eukprot:KXZ49921.1 hypothetical protein GPECTOR_19g372 [Gonium pectorale]